MQYLNQHDRNDRTDARHAW